MTTVWVALGVLALFAVLLFLSAVRLHRIERDCPWLHPPDDDDGVSILEEDDPDGEYTR